MAQFKESTIDGNLIMLGNPIAFNSDSTMSISSLSLPSGYEDILSWNNMLARVLKAPNSKYAIAGIANSTASKSGIRVDDNNVCLWSKDGIEVHTSGQSGIKIAEIDGNGRYLATAEPQARNVNYVRLYGSTMDFNINDGKSTDDSGSYTTLPFANNRYTIDTGSGAPQIEVKVAASEIAELGNGLYLYAITITMQSGQSSISTGNISLKDNLWFRIWLPAMSRVLNAQVSSVCDDYRGTVPYWFIKQGNLAPKAEGIGYLDICMTKPFDGTVKPGGFSLMLVARRVSDDYTAPVNAAASADNGIDPNAVSLTLSKSSVTLNSGDSITLTATSSESTPISWSVESSNNYLCPVSIDSSMTASGGSITVTASGGMGSASVVAETTINGMRLTEKCYINVRPTMITPGGPGGFCFEAGTQVTMGTGRTKNIEDIKVGDYVLSYNTNSGSFTTLPVKEVFKVKQKTGLVRLRFSDGTILDTTDTHPFFTMDGWVSLRPDYPYDSRYEDLAYKEVHMMEVGQRFYKVIDGKIANVELAEIINKIDAGDDHYVYNLDVARHNTFFTNGILGHNTKGIVDHQ